jgi:hypothetical protein
LFGKERGKNSIYFLLLGTSARIRIWLFILRHKVSGKADYKGKVHVTALHMQAFFTSNVFAWFETVLNLLRSKKSIHTREVMSHFVIT